MQELKFFEAYTGQTIDELIGMTENYRIDSLVLAIEAALYHKAEMIGFEKLSDEEQIVLAIEALEREVNNGGYRQFFLNSPRFVSIIVDSLKKIKCLKMAQITEQAIHILGINDLTVEEAIIERVINDDDEQRYEALGRCDDMYYNCHEGIADCLFEFIKENKGAMNLIPATIRIIF